MTRSAHHISRWLVAAIPFAFLHQGSSTNPPVDPVGKLMARVKSGEAKLAFEPKQGYLRAILAELKIDASTQTLVFAKNSLQSSHISPETPRALYFNDRVYVGWIPGAPLIEIMSVDPIAGAKFYTIKNELAPTMTVAREDKECTRCHGRSSSYHASSLFVNSVYAAPSGYARVFSEAFRVGPDTPMRMRWGGWYVTGTHGGQRHMGNEQALGTDEAFKINTERGANVTNLDRHFDTKRYLTPHSDIAALMVAEQQMHAQNVLSNTGLAIRAAIKDGESIDALCDELAEALVSQGEIALTSPIKGTSDFAQTWSARGELWTLDLKTRIYRYACSPLIYSESFDLLPVASKKYVYQRLREGLTSGKLRPDISVEDRKKTLEILSATKPDFSAN